MIGSSLSALSRRSLLLAVMLCLTAAASHWIQPSQTRTSPPPDIDSLIPTRFSHWLEDRSMIARPISALDAAKATTLYARTLERVYVNQEQQRIMLSISYSEGQTDRLQAHRPEFCYQAQGFTIAASSDGSLTTAQGPLPIRRLDTRRPGRSEPVSYWLTVGDEAVLPGLSRKLAQLLQGLSRQGVDSVLVRVSSISESSNEAYALHEQFIRDLLAAMPVQDRIRLVGSPKIS